MRRKGIPCGPDCCSPSKHCVKAINNVSPDPNGDLTLKAGSGIAISQSDDNEITITNDAIASSFVAGDNIEINPSGDDLEIRVTDDVSINNLNVAGNIIQQGAAYETHAEKIFTTNDYIYMRDGAVGGLPVGSFAGFQVEKYDGTNDGRLVIDKDGTARVGDVGDEQPLLTRDESASLNNGDLLQWNSTAQKAVSANVNTSQIVRGSGNIGSDTKPIKVVNGVATAVSDNLCKFIEVKTGEATFTFIPINGYADLTVTFDTAMPDTNYGISLVKYGVPGWVNVIECVVINRTAAGFTIRAFGASGGDATNIVVIWTAIRGTHQ